MTEQSELALKRLREMKGQPYRQRKSPPADSNSPPIQDQDRLERWIGQAGLHWEEHLPTRYREHLADGTLPQALRRAAELTATEMDSLLEAGFDPDQAWEMVRNEYLFVPPEPEKPRKGRSRAHRMTKDLQEQADLIDRAFSSEE